MKTTMPLYRSPNREMNQLKFGDDGCICCLRPISDNNNLFVHMNTDWLAVNPDMVNETNCFELTGAE